jgi:hypothetical protein
MCVGGFIGAVIGVYRYAGTFLPKDLTAFFSFVPVVYGFLGAVLGGALGVAFGFMVRR